MRKPTRTKTTRVKPSKHRKKYYVSRIYQKCPDCPHSEDRKIWVIRYSSLPSHMDTWGLNRQSGYRKLYTKFKNVPGDIDIRMMVDMINNGAQADKDYAFTVLRECGYNWYNYYTGYSY